MEIIYGDYAKAEIKMHSGVIIVIIVFMCQNSAGSYQEAVRRG